MKMLGKVVSISNGKLVVKMSSHIAAGKDIRTGEKVFDETGNFVGNILEYFGPTEKPYVLVSSKKKPENYEGKEVFV
jgi:rRNA processing protein Gar1